jgi:hypothetical protein
MREFSVWWRDICVGSFFLFLMFLIGGAIHFPSYYGNIVGEFIQAVNAIEVEK